LLEGATEMKFRGRFAPVKAAIVPDGEFSVHAAGSALIDWLAALDPKPHTVFCVHGEQDSADNLAARIRRELGLVAVVPHYREVVALQPVDGLPVVQPVAPAQPAPQHAAEPTSTPEPSDVSPGARLTFGGAGTHADDRAQVEVILTTALGQVPFVPDDKRAGVEAALQGAIARVGGDRAALLDAVNQALYAAASAVETPGGQSIVALLAHVPKVLR